MLQLKKPSRVIAEMEKEQQLPQPPPPLLQLPQLPREVVVNIDLLNSINDRLNNNLNNKLNDDHRVPMSLDRGTIHRVYESIRDQNPKAYHPQLVAIGPYHRRDTLLLPMERLKNQLFRDLIARDKSNTVNDYIKAVNDPSFVVKARECYSDTAVLLEEENAFVEMMVFDGCFIIEFIVRQVLHRSIVGVKGPTASIIRRDLYLLENQIPFSVLQVLYDSSVIPDITKKFGPLTLKELFLKYITNGRDKNWKQPVGHDIHHLLHLLEASLAETLNSSASRSGVTPTKFGTLRLVTHRVWQHFISPAFFWLLLVLFTCQRPSVYKRVMKAPRWMPNASEMNESGITFEKKETIFFWDVSFRSRDRVMEMPLIEIDEQKESLIRNLAAFEQRCPLARSNFSAYVTLLKGLIEKAEDVAVLERSGVLESNLGSLEEVVKIFNDLGEAEYLDSDHCLEGLFKEMCDLSTTERYIWRAASYKWKTILVQNYFSSPWSTCSLIAAIVLLLLTLCQTLFAMLAYFRPPSST